MEENHVLVELYNSLEDSPGNVDIYESILTQWSSMGDADMAVGTARDLLSISPGNQKAQSCLRMFAPQPAEERRPSRSIPIRVAQAPTANVGRTLDDLEKGYVSLKLEAKIILEEVKYVIAKSGEDSTGGQDGEIIEKLEAIAAGKISSAVPLAQPLSVRESSRRILSDPAQSAALIKEDFEAVVHATKYQSPPLPTDAIRARLIRRKALLDASLPDSMAPLTAAAFTNVERDYLQKKYVNGETMLGDAIAEIPPANFFVSEDNYAWDMDELASAISANGGVMRNPLSREMFSEEDIRMILEHPLGQRLRAQHEAQHRMKRGFRTATIDWVEKLGKIMLDDQSSDAGPSRRVMDEFLAYMITLPKAEQQTINSLKIPGKDRNTGQEFDYAIGESVRDAKANTTCFHKVGDFLSQAGRYLRRQ